MNYLRFFSDYTVIDLETTGLDPKRDEIIEIGAAQVRDGMIMQTYSTLIRPNAPITEFITNLTGISQLDVANAPLIEDVIDDFFGFVGDDIIVGHNVGFDISFINEVRRFDPDISDTMRISRSLFPMEPHHKLSNLREWFGIRSTHAHRALDDVLATNRAYIALKQYADENGITEEKMLAGEQKWRQLRIKKNA